MHITVVTRDMRGGGAQRVIAQLLEKWSKQQIQCSLVCVYPNEYFYGVPEAVARYDVSVCADNPNMDKLKRYQYLRKLLKEIQPDIVLSFPEEIGIYVVLAMLGTGIPVVVSERNNPWVMPDKKISRIARRLAYPFAKGLIFQTKQASMFFPKNQQKKGVVLPNPLDAARLPKVYTGAREKIVVSAGRLEKQKNFALLIKAFAAFYKEHNDYKLVIYGEGSKRSELEALAEKELPDGTWSFPGQVNNLAERIAKAEIFALSSDYEGVPNVLIEAMAVGTPAVSTDCAPGGAAELIENEKNGLLVPVGDINALAQGLCYMAEHPQEASRMAGNAVEVRSLLDAEQVAARWLDYLEKCGE